MMYADLLFIALAEVVTTIMNPQAGLLMHGLLLIAMLLQAAWSKSPAGRGFYLALALAPLIRLLSLSMPLNHFPTAYRYLVVGAPLFLAALLVARTGNLKLPKTRITFPHLLFQIIVGITGIGIGFVEYLLLRPDPLVAAVRWERVWLPALVLLVFTGLLEELIFRGLVQTAAVDSLGRPGLLYVAVLFTILNLGHRSWLNLLFVFVVALFFGWTAYRTRSILGVTLSHGLANIGLFLVFPILLAG